MEAAQRGGLTPVELLAATLSDNDRVAVTGASGWFGATALDLLYQLWGEAASSRVRGYASSARDITLPSGRRVPVRALPQLLDEPPFSALLHFAYLTRDRVGEAPSAYVAANLQISSTVLAAIRLHRPRLVVTASSGAVYEPTAGLSHDLETNPYGVLKVIDELAFAQASQDVGAGWAIPRVFTVAGPGMTKPEKYALGSMIAMARGGGPIQIKADHPVYRSYCGVSEVIALATWAAARDRSAIFDTGGHIVEMAELATEVAHALDQDCDVLRPSYDSAATPDRYIGDPRHFLTLAGESGLALASMEELITSTAFNDRA